MTEYFPAVEDILKAQIMEAIGVRRRFIEALASQFGRLLEALCNLIISMLFCSIRSHKFSDCSFKCQIFCRNNRYFAGRLRFSLP
ncbi:hypothetical protein Syun_022762 [Stephania yunnanensis]|uniref:Uncharacterized protein n=1 Tax=Stephania yunnanensis TaxID=152371 RepID=A0AAP0F8J6_9MAGN